MRFLFLGYKPYLPEVIAALRDTAFIRENEIDITFAQPFQRKPEKIALDSTKKQLRDDELSLLLEDVARYQQITPTLFPDIDLTFLRRLPNVRLLVYEGLEKLPELIQLWHYDAMIVASYGRKIPREIFAQPRMGTFNIHPSYLPDLRGGYPTYLQAFDPQQIRGVTIHQMADDWDDGDIVAQVRYETPPDLTNEALLLRSADYAADLLDQLHRRGFQFEPKGQDLSRVSECRRLLKRQHNITHINRAADFEGFVRANYDRYLFPFTFAMYQSRLFVILKAEYVPQFAPTAFPLRQIFERDGAFFIRFEQRVYQVTEYMYQGKFVAQPVLETIMAAD